jgi:hypothetical protein
MGLGNQAYRMSLMEEGGVEMEEMSPIQMEDERRRDATLL